MSSKRMQSFIFKALLLQRGFSSVFSFVQQQQHSPLQSLSISTCQGPNSESASSTTRLFMSTTRTYMDALSQAASEALGRSVKFQPSSGGGYSGGGGGSTSAVMDPETGTRYFVKSAGNGLKMLRAEYLGVKEMADTNTIRCPRPVAYGVYEKTNTAFCIFEYLEFVVGGSQYELGQQLAKMHRVTSDKGFGFHVDNTIGATPQPNTWRDDWVDFWLEHRLGHMLKLTDGAGMNAERRKKLEDKTRELLSHKPVPSLMHGDLWGGNKAFCKGEDGKPIPVIFDPATYYGDREADVAMTYLFGGFTSDFYRGYEDEWPLPAGHEKRRTVYNLYHILNHEVLFGGGYLRQARNMIEEILRS